SEVPDGLVAALNGKPLNDVRGWLKALVDEHAGELTFEQWAFPDVEPSDLEVIGLEPFVDSNGAAVRGTGLHQPAGMGTDLEARTGAKIRIKWAPTPRKPQNVKAWSISLVPDRATYDPDEVAGVELPSIRATPSKRTERLEVTFDTDIEVRKVQVRVTALDEMGGEIRRQDDQAVVEALSIPFWLSVEQDEGGDDAGPRRKSTETSLAMVLFKYAMKAPKAEETLDIKWLPEEREDGRPLYHPVLVNDRHIYRLASTPYLAAVERHCLEHPGGLGRYRAASAVDALG
ncbi:unnamed protein product, partial [marine sediment metagenome]